MKVEDISSFSAYTRNTEVQTGWSKLDATRRAETRKVVIGVLARNASRQSPTAKSFTMGLQIT